jgi:hypothetical protein
MRLYRLHTRDSRDGSHGYLFFASKRAALKTVRGLESEDFTIEPIDVEPTKAGIMRALNRYASHPDNG